MQRRSSHANLSANTGSNPVSLQSLIDKNLASSGPAVKNGDLTAELRDAVKRHQEQINQQQQLIESLKKLVCNDHPGSDVCK
jgi:hypothetical protein